MPSLPVSKTIHLPYSNQIADQQGYVSQPWQSFLNGTFDRLSPLGVETSFDIVNNQSSAANVTGLVFNSKNVSQAVVDYLLQRVTTSTGAVELVESGSFTVAYKPTSKTWNLINLGITGFVSFVTSSSNITLGATYTNNGHIFTALNTLSSGTLLLAVGDGLPSTSGTLTKASGTGDSTVTFSSRSVTTKRIPDNAGVTFSITSAGQVQYTSSSITGTASISKLYWRARTIAGKNSQYSQVGGGGR